MIRVDEIWKDIKGYEGYYQISNHGRVKSLERTTWNSRGNGFWQTIKERYLLYDRAGNKKTHFIVWLSRDGGKHRYLIHRLVAEHFIGDIPDGMLVDHKDENPENNRVDNLQIITPSKNIKKSRDIKGARKHVRTKVLVNDLETNEKLIFNTARDAGKYLNKSDTSVISHLEGIYSGIIDGRYEVSRI